MTLPDLWSDFSVDEVSEAVHDEYPGYWQAVFLESIFGTMQVDTYIFEQC